MYLTHTIVIKSLNELIHVPILVSYGLCFQALWPRKGCIEPSRVLLRVSALCAGHREHPCPQSPPQCNVPKARGLLTQTGTGNPQEALWVSCPSPREQFSPLLKLRPPRGSFQVQKWFLISVLHDFLFLAVFLSHLSFHSSLLLRAKAFSVFTISPSRGCAQGSWSVFF